MGNETKAVEESSVRQALIEIAAMSLVLGNQFSRATVETVLQVNDLTDLWTEAHAVAEAMSEDDEEDDTAEMVSP
jgi:hypothetical protein